MQNAAHAFAQKRILRARRALAKLDEEGAA
jgi:hypothetical protein